MKLRDIGKAVGFNVYWNAEDGSVQIETDKPYTGEAPAKGEAADDADAMKQDIVDRTNALRKENGVAALRVNDKLMQAAQVRADEMAAHTAYSHTRPDGRKVQYHHELSLHGRKYPSYCGLDVIRTDAR